jgi:2',3'-cyclic-nucleotide 2'-phosphodiesterase/3'-nucleotidase
MNRLNSASERPFFSGSASPEQGSAGKRRNSRSVISPLLVFLLGIALCLQAGAQSPGASNSADSPDKVTITLLSTTDIHGHIEPFDYFANKTSNLGLAKIATLVREVRAESPNALLFDCGDTIEGTPLAYYFAVKDSNLANPTIAAMNTMRYDAAAVGNHEFNFGLDVMWKAKGEANFPWLAANIHQTYTEGIPYFQPYIFKTVAGVRIAIVGFVTPGIPRWEIPAHYKGYEFENIVDAAHRVIPEVRKQADLLVVIVHSGLDRDPKSAPGSKPSDAFDQIPGENAALELAEQVPGIDVVFYGHTHQEMPELVVNGVLLTQPKNWGGSLARADVQMDRDAKGHWNVKSKHSRTIPATAAVAADPEIEKIDAPYHAATQKYLDTPIANSSVPLEGTLGRIEDTPLVDVIHFTQMEYGHADVSMATMFFLGVRIPAGPVTVRQAAALYVYENTLYTVEMSGAQLKEALEHSASFFPAWPFPAGKPVALPNYNSDSAMGVAYVIDLSRPVGDRIRYLRYHNHALDPAEKLRVAINNYRYTGGGGYGVYKGLPVVYRSSQEIRELLIEYISRTGRIPIEPVETWRIEPLEARQALVEAARKEAAAHATAAAAH